MRVISGKFRGTLLAEFAGKSIRPTSDRVRESLFNIISQRVIDARVLDAFSGSGAIGIECISRGCKSVHFNDIDRESLAVLKKNLAKLKIVDGYTLTNKDALQLLHEVREGYDLIFVDPPYALEVGVQALKLIGKKGLLNDGGLAVFERNRSFSGEVEGLRVVSERKYGKTYLTFFEKNI